MENLAIIQELPLSPTMDYYAEAQGFNRTTVFGERLYNRKGVTVQFRKAKIKDKTFLEVEYLENLVFYSQSIDDLGNKIEVSEIINSYPFKTVIPMFIHKDLENSFKKLTAHVLFRNCWVTDDKYNSLQQMQFESLGLEYEFEDFWTDWEQRQASDNDYRLLNWVSVYGVSFSGFAENESVLIHSKVKNQYGKEYKNDTTLVQIDNVDEKYHFAKDLRTAVESLKNELIQYMYFGKVGDIANNQLDMFNDNQD